MPFDEVVYPVTGSYGTSEGPGHSTTIVASDSGAEERSTQWDGAQLRFHVAHNPTSHADLAALQRFARKRRGALNGFLYKSSLDFSSAADDGAGFVSAPADTDQLLGVGDGVQTAFQLVKHYADDLVDRVRNIRKPIAGTVVLAINDVSQPSGWTVNDTTGIVTFDVAPGLGAEVTAGFQFHVPVRFGEGVDKLLSAQLQDFGSGALDVELVELIDETPVQDEFCYRGGSSIDMEAGYALTVNNGCALVLNPIGATRTATLPDETDLPLGGPYFFIRNGSGIENLLVKDIAGTMLATMAPGATRTVALFDDGSGGKQWLAW